MKVIIESKDVPIERAINCVRQVIDGGMISEARGIKKYCSATVYESGIVVYCKDRRSNDSAHSFVVHTDGYYK